MKEQKEKQEKGFTKNNVENILSEADFERMKQFYQLPFKFLLAKVEFEFNHDSIYFAGNSKTYFTESL